MDRQLVSGRGPLVGVVHRFDMQQTEQLYHPPSTNGTIRPRAHPRWEQQIVKAVLD